MSCKVLQLIWTWYLLQRTGHSYLVLLPNTGSRACTSLLEFIDLKLNFPTICFFFCNVYQCLLTTYHEYFCGYSVIYTVPNWNTLGIMVITQFNHIIAFLWIKRQFYRGKVNKISSTACWLLKLFVTFTLFMYEIVKIVDVTKSCSCCLTNQH